MSEMASHKQFGHLQHKLWSKEGSGVKLASNWQFDSRPLKVRNRPDPGVCRCDIPLKFFQGELQVCFRPRPNRRSEREVMNTQSPGSPNQDNFGTPLWESRDKESFECGCGGVTQIILYGGRWWLPPSPGRGESSEFVLLVACPNTKSVPNVN
jgi:hypothetical protein